MPSRYANLGQVFNYLNRPDEGTVQVDLALRLNPHDPRRFMWLPYLAASHYLSRRYKACLDASEQALWPTRAIRTPYVTWWRRWANSVACPRHGRC